MIDAPAAMTALMEQSRVNFHQENLVRRTEAQKNAVFNQEMQRLQHERSLENEISKRMNAIMADMMTGLKKAGTEIRQTNG
jgi:hypothetical protein